MYCNHRRTRQTLSLVQPKCNNLILKLWRPLQINKYYAQHVKLRWSWDTCLVIGVDNIDADKSRCVSIRPKKTALHTTNKSVIVLNESVVCEWLCSIFLLKCYLIHVLFGTLVEDKKNKLSDFSLTRFVNGITAPNLHEHFFFTLQTF